MFQLRESYVYQACISATDTGQPTSQRNCSATIISTDQPSRMDTNVL